MLKFYRALDSAIQIKAGSVKPRVKDKIMAAVAAGHDSQKAIAEAIGKTIQNLRADLKELVAEGHLIEGSVERNRKVYRLPIPLEQLE